LCVCEAGDYQKGGTTNRSEIDRPHGSFLLHLYSRANHVPFSRQPFDPSDLNQQFVQCSNIHCDANLQDDTLIAGGCSLENEIFSSALQPGKSQAAMVSA